jgi:hypothetical protein
MLIPENFNNNFLKKWKNNDPESLNKYFQMIGDDIYFGKIFSDEFCNNILSNINDYEHNNKKHIDENKANSMHQMSIPINKLGLKEEMDELVNKYLFQISSSLFPKRCIYKFDSQHSYIVRYLESGDNDLDFHVDDSLITFNLCLNDNCEGSEIIFEGPRCPKHLDSYSDSKEVFKIKHRKGFAIIHDGKNRHRVEQILAGERINLIIWCQNNNEKNNWFNALKRFQCLDFCNHSLYNN